MAHGVLYFRPCSNRWTHYGRRARAFPRSHRPAARPAPQRRSPAGSSDAVTHAAQRAKFSTGMQNNRINNFVQGKACVRFAQSPGYLALQRSASARGGETSVIERREREERGASCGRSREALRRDAAVKYYRSSSGRLSLPLPGQGTAGPAVRSGRIRPSLVGPPGVVTPEPQTLLPPPRSCCSPARRSPAVAPAPRPLSSNAVPSVGRYPVPRASGGIQYPTE